MEKTEITDGMRSWKEQLAFEAAEKKRMRAKWVKQAAALKIGVTDAAKQLGLHPKQLQNQFTKHGIKSERPRAFVVNRTESQRDRAIMLKQLRDRAARKIAAGYKPDYARLEAAREMQIEMGARVHTHEAQA